MHLPFSLLSSALLVAAAPIADEEIKLGNLASVLGQTATFDYVIIAPFLQKRPVHTAIQHSLASTEPNTAAFSPAGGPLQVSFANYAQPFSTWVEPAINSVGIAPIADFNSGSLLGAQYCSSAIRPNTQTQILFSPSLKATEVPVESSVLPGPLTSFTLYAALQFAGPYTLQKRGPLTNPVCNFPGWEKIRRRLLSPEIDQTLNSTFPRIGQKWNTYPWVFPPMAPVVVIWGFFERFGRPRLRRGLQQPISQPTQGRLPVRKHPRGLVAPFSRGTITLRSADTRDRPLINLNYLTDLGDVQAAITTYKRPREIFVSNAMAGVLVNPGEDYFQGLDLQTDEEILQTIRETLMAIWHAERTCRMGKMGDPMAVVDSNAKVIDVEGLRVVDASSLLYPPCCER
ncbi:GMC oxidoreductase-domain-containing protein [Immersiella caudata]|uniref:GMC oxidoreductase-domain-containing protein n=1 Tax=Immersiella caudata TaxID=314043 RepID=A0AA39U5S2_9PEZI|nr:GMC oxidoreductase-domain-containing protein [Immersiella caudata]